MGHKTLDYRLVKQYRSYRIRDVVDLFGLHENTVSNWLSDDLEPIDSKKPTLIHGSILKQYIKYRRASKKVKLKCSELYCFGCQKAREPSVDSITVIPPEKGGAYLLKATCPTCRGKMSKKASLRQVKQIGGDNSLSDNSRDEELQGDWVNGQ